MRKALCGLLLASANLLVAETTSRLEVRAGAFFPQSKLFREIYGNVGACYEVQATTNLTHCLDGWLGFDWFSKHGRSKGKHSPTSIQIGNVSFGVQVPYVFSCCLTGYVGIGPSFGRVSIKNHSQCTHEKVSKTIVGGLVHSGFYYSFGKCMFLDVFVDYLYQPVHFHRHDHIGGLKTGLGVGVGF